MLGTVVNCAAIIIGSLTGVLLKKGIPDKVKDNLMNGLALCTGSNSCVSLPGFHNFICQFTERSSYNRCY